MFITQQLNTISELVEGQGLSDQLQHLLAQQYLNLEATLLRAKVLRDFQALKFSILCSLPFKQNMQRSHFYLHLLSWQI